MKKVFAGALVALTTVLAGNAKGSTSVPQFEATLGSALLNLNAVQTNSPGLAAGDHLPILGSGQHRSVTWDANETLDVVASLNALVSDQGSVVRFSGGHNPGLESSGASTEEQGKVTSGSPGQDYRSVAFLFSGAASEGFQPFAAGQDSGEKGGSGPDADPGHIWWCSHFSALADNCFD